MNFRKIYGKFLLNYKKISYHYGNKMLFNGKKGNIPQIYGNKTYP